MSLSYRNRVLDVLENSELPMDVESIRAGAGIGNWQTAKAILLELLVEGLVKGQKSTKFWTFWISKENPEDDARKR